MQTPAESLTVFTFWRGRVALYAILKALGIGAGDHVIVPGYTCFAVPAAVQFAGAAPIYADIEPATYNVSLGTVQGAFKSNPAASVKAILIQHTFGIPADTEPLVRWARERGIYTIEDCAHAWGTRYRTCSGEWMDVGALGDAAFYSSQWTKPVSTGVGGWARINCPEIRDAVRRFQEENCEAPARSEVIVLAAQLAARGALSHPRLTRTVKAAYQALYSRGIVAGTSSVEELHGRMPAGYAKRMSHLQEWLLHRKLRDDSIVTHRRRLKTIYDRELGNAGLGVLQIPEYAEPVLLRYPVRVRMKDDVLREAGKRGFEIGDWYAAPVDHPKDVSLDAFDYRRGMCPEGERAALETINLPMNRTTSERAARKMAAFLAKATR